MRARLGALTADVGEDTCDFLNGEEVRGGTRQKNQTEPSQQYPKRTLAIWRQLQNAHERNRAELPMQLGLASKVNG